jgi:hypothetical protein
MGLVGEKEKFVAKRYIEKEYKEQDRNTSLWVEKRHQNGVRGQFFDKFEDLLTDDNSIAEYKNFEDYVKQDCGTVGYIDSLIIDNIDEDKSDSDYTFEELKDIVKEYGDSEIVEAFEQLKEDETLYILSSCNGECISTDKNSLILYSLADGQYQRVYSNIDEIIEAIENDDEAATVYIYNYMSIYEKDKFLEEYEN